MASKQVMNAKIEPIQLNGLQIKEKIERFISIEADRYPTSKILFEHKDNDYVKLPFSDFKISIAQELEDQKLLIQQIQDGEFELIEENVVVEEAPVVEEPAPTPIVEEPVPSDEPEFSVIEELYEYEDEGKKPKDRYRSKIKQVDTAAVIAKIKAEAREKNKGKKVTSFRDINKELRPYMIKKMKGVNVVKDAMSSIDIYLNAVDKIDVVDSSTTHPEANQPNINEIIDDLDK